MSACEALAGEDQNIRALRAPSRSVRIEECGQVRMRSSRIGTTDGAVAAPVTKSGFQVKRALAEM
jgi:hypothetical protein